MKRKPAEGNTTFCMAPWTHTFVSPQLERRLCCASRESSTNFKQYIDSIGPNTKETGVVKFNSLQEHWNSAYMQTVRKKLMAGESIPQCDVCNHKLLNENVYRNHFNSLYNDLIDQAFESTDNNGHTSMQPQSFDYRFNNLCNFKCRMCGDMLSSLWEAENKLHGVGDYQEHNIWGRNDIKQQIEWFQDNVIVKEFKLAVEQKRLTEIYWCGGEPLMWKIHWESMQRIVELGYAGKVNIRYNSNMSKIKQYGYRLFEDILVHFKQFLICASIDGTGQIGEYIRTGLDYDSWLKNIKHSKNFVDGRYKRLELDVTLSLPGMFDLENIYNLANDLKIKLLSKQVFNFSPNNFMSPMFLPYQIMTDLIDQFLDTHKVTSYTQTLFAQLEEMKSSKRNNDLKYSHDEYIKGQQEGKKKAQFLDKIRQNDIEKILQLNQQCLDWWQSIEV